MVDQVTYTPVVLITANVGSIFEDPDRMLKIWLEEFQKMVKNLQPSFIALHMQEVGGKNYEASMQHVNLFVKSMFRHDSLLKYDRAQVFLDEDYTASDKFTALGNIYFIHESIEKAEIWSFQEFKFVTVEGKEVLSGNIESITTKEKAKFPQHFFPEFKWSRKGFMRTRWNINNCIFDLVNIHLFHDASNIVAMQNSPSTYCGNRQQTLLHTLDRFAEDKYDKVPMFMFGDFNFRLDLQLLVKAITRELISKEETLKDQLSNITYTEDCNGEKPVLTVSSKRFDHHHKHASVFGKPEKWLHDYDTEMEAFKDRLFEYDISFSPSYPYSEDTDDGVSYMKTRCPAWCDRIVMSHDTQNIIHQEEKRRPKYTVLGKSSCMGDHKPVYLSFHLVTGKGNYVAPDACMSRPRPRSMSINGEHAPDMSGWNVHDYAIFNDESVVREEGYISMVKRRSSSERRKSFYSLVKQVQVVKQVVEKWPRYHHHSSSSDEDGSDVVADGKQRGVKTPHSPQKSPLFKKLLKTVHDKEDTVGTNLTVGGGESTGGKEDTVGTYLTVGGGESTGGKLLEVNQSAGGKLLEVNQSAGGLYVTGSQMTDKTLTDKALTDVKLTDVKLPCPQSTDTDKPTISGPVLDTYQKNTGELLSEFTFEPARGDNRSANDVPLKLSSVTTKDGAVGEHDGIDATC